ncbi:MAG: tetratricopeptide repeat protein, partial [Anaerolineales bacterium]|nr:tetratricopeptide repeat protein [Anaerolineales bacterium]
MLATIREYAGERLEASPNATFLHRRHAAAFLNFAEQAAPKLRGPQQTRWLRRIELAHANLRVALTWALEHGEAELALPLVTALADFWAKAGHLLEGRGWIARALCLPAAQGATPLRAAALNAAAETELNYTDVDYTLPAAYLRESIATSRQTGASSTLAYGCLGLGTILLATDIDAAQTYGDESLNIFRSTGDRWGEARALALLARLAICRNEMAVAEELTKASVAIFTALGDRWSIGYTLLVQAYTLHFEQQQYDRARDLYEEALAIGELSGEKVIIATALSNLADLALIREDYTATERFARRALPLLDELGELWQPPRLLRLLGICAAIGGNGDQATKLVGDSIELNRRLGDHRAVIAGLIALAHRAL